MTHVHKFQDQPNNWSSGANMQREQRLALKTEKQCLTLDRGSDTAPEGSPGCCREDLKSFRYSLKQATAVAETSRWPQFLKKACWHNRRGLKGTAGITTHIPLIFRRGWLLPLFISLKISLWNTSGMQPPAALGCCLPQEIEILEVQNKAVITIVATSLSCSSSSKGVHG